jgi:hypothetical protein
MAWGDFSSNTLELMNALLPAALRLKLKTASRINVVNFMR